MKDRLALFALTAVLLSACTSPPLATEEGIPAAPPPLSGGGSLEEQFVRQTVLSLRDSFVQRDTASFMRHVSDGFYLGHRRLATVLNEEFAAPGEPGLAVEFLAVSVNDPRVTAVVRWERDVNGVASSSGTTEFIFQKGDTLSLVNFRGDPLFGISGF